jgi:hypothetical protein
MVMGKAELILLERRLIDTLFFWRWHCSNTQNSFQCSSSRLRISSILGKGSVRINLRYKTLRFLSSQTPRKHGTFGRIEVKGDLSV